MRGLRNLILAVACALATGTSIAADGAPSAPAISSSAAKLPTVGDTAGMLAFQRDLVSVLAPRADPLPLLAAALLARPLQGPQGKYQDFHSLIERAAKADGAGPEVNWTRLTDCPAHACPNSSALNQLVQQAPDNAAVWLFKLGVDAQAGKTAAVRNDLARAASAKLYDDYTGASLKALASSVSVLPPPTTAMQPSSSIGPLGTQLVLVFGTASTQPQPGLQATAKVCSDGAADQGKQGQGVRDDCLKLAKLLEWGSSPLARSLGLHLREVLSTDAAQQSAAKDARRSLIWQMQSFAELSAKAPGDKSLAQHMLGLARNGGTEMSLILAAMRDYGMATEPPTDWQPQRPAS